MSKIPRLQLDVENEAQQAPAPQHPVSSAGDLTGPHKVLLLKQLLVCVPEQHLRRYERKKN